MDEHPIQDLMTTAMENIQNMIEVNTIIGDPIKSPDGSMIIPVSKVGFGFAAGGSEFTPENVEDKEEVTLPFGGGSGGGVSITPVAFLIVSNDGVNLVHMDGNTKLYETLKNIAPMAVEKVQHLLKQEQQNGNQDDDSSKKDNRNKDKSRKDYNI